MQNNNLSTKAMLADLSLSVWNPRKHDKKESSDVAARHNASSDIVRVNKNLIDLKAPSYVAYTQSAGALRMHFYTNTLPWSDEGPRILPATNYLPFIQEQRALRSSHDRNVQNFVDDSAVLFTEGVKRLNGMGNHDDYPTYDKLTRKFSYNLNILPMPDASDFRVNLSNDDVESIRYSITEQVNASVSNAMTDLYTRLHDSVSHMAERLGTVDAIFRDSLIDNIKAHCDLIPRLNLTGDANLEAMRQRIENELTQIPASELRDDTRARSTIADRAKQIQSDLAAFMGA